MKKKKQKEEILGRYYDAGNRRNEIMEKLIGWGFADVIINSDEVLKSCLLKKDNYSFAAKTGGMIYERTVSVLKNIAGRREKAEASEIMGELSRRIFMNYVIECGHDSEIVINGIRETIRKICKGNKGEFEKFLYYFNPEFPCAINIMEGYNTGETGDYRRPFVFFEKLLRHAKIKKYDKEKIRITFGKTGMVHEIFSFYNTMISKMPDDGKKKFDEEATGFFLSGFIKMADSKLDNANLFLKKDFLHSVKTVFPQLCLAILRKSGGREKELLKIIREKIEKYCSVFSEIKVNTIAFFCRRIHTLPEFAGFLEQDEFCQTGYIWNYGRTKKEQDMFGIIYELASFIAKPKIKLIRKPLGFCDMFKPHYDDHEWRVKTKEIEIIAVILYRLFEDGMIESTGENFRYKDFEKHIRDWNGKPVEFDVTKTLKRVKERKEEKKFRKNKLPTFKELNVRVDSIFTKVWAGWKKP